MSDKNSQKTRIVQTDKQVTQISGWKKAVLWFTTIVIIPALFFILVETVFRVSGYGFNPSFFLNGPGWVRTNPAFSRLCFPPVLARSPVSARMPSPKPFNTYRIFILGESAAQGFPSVAHSFGRVLEAMLRDRFPGTQFEVVNAAVTAINSHIILSIAKDCAKQQADIFIIYAGNNEVVGPFGPGTSFTGFSPSRSLIRLNLDLKKTRFGQFMVNLAKWRQPPEEEWHGLEMFLDKAVAANDERLQEMYGYFGKNLSDILEIAKNAGIKTIVCTAGVNLKDCSPFISLHRDGLNNDKKTQWQTLYDEAISLETAGQYSAAIEKYNAAARIDDRYAELHFRLAKTRLVMEEKDQAYVSCTRARDLDALRIRTDSSLNKTIRSVAVNREREGIYLVDAEDDFSKNEYAPDGVPGSRLFEDHVHMTFHGNYVLARSVYRKLKEILPVSVLNKAKGGDLEEPSESRCMDLLVYTPHERVIQLKILKELIDKPPFTNQYDHQERIKAFEEELKSMSALVTRETVHDYIRKYETAIALAPDDVWLRFGYEQLLSNIGLAEQGYEHLMIALKQDPTHFQVLWSISRNLADRGKYKEEETYLRRMLELDPYASSVRKRMPMNLLAQGKTDTALRFLSKTLKEIPDTPGIHYSFALVYRQLGKYQKAAEELEKEIALAPNANETVSSLLWLLVSAPDPAVRNGYRALELARQLVSAAPADLSSYDALAAAFSETGQYEKAVKAAMEAIRLFEVSGNNNPNILKTLKQRLTHYKNEAPYHTLARW